MEGNRDVGFADWVAALRTELQRCLDEADNSGGGLRFAMGPVSLELEVTSGRTSEGKGEVKFWVVGTGRNVQYTNQTKQKISLTLTPDIDGQQVRINDQLNERPR